MNQIPASLYVGYVLKRYPRFSETFVVNEILAHERSGMKADIFALGAVMETHFQDIISQVKAPVYRLQDKRHNTDSLWALFRQAYKTLPNFSQKIAVIEHKNIHELAQAIMLALMIKERGIQHLHAHFGTKATTITRLAANFSDVSYSFTAHAKDIYYPYEENIELDLKLRDAAQTITVSNYNLAYLQEKYGNDAKNIVRIYNGLDLSKFPYTPPQNRPRHILAVGRLVPKKGFNILIEAIQLLKSQGEHFSCTLIGDGVLSNALQTQIERADLTNYITLVGQKPQPEIIKAMNEAAIVVAPCIISDEGDRDGLPTVLLESMALGTPVISTHVAGIPELVVNNKTGLCVESQNPQALANAILYLLNNPLIGLNLAHSARHLIELEYNIDINTAHLRELFNKAIAKNNKSIKHVAKP